MLDPAREKCDLHICAAGIVLMQLELLEVQRLRVLCHSEVAILSEERIFATCHDRASAFDSRNRTATQIPAADDWDFYFSIPSVS